MQGLSAVLSDRAARQAYFARDLHSFGKFYFSEVFKCEGAPFHRDITNALRGPKHVMVKAFREAAKTVWLRIFYVWAIAYRKRRFLMHYSFEEELAEALLFDVVTALQTNPLLIADFGELYPGAARDGLKQKAGISEFITTNGVKVKAMSIGKTPRGAVFQTFDGAHRPDLIGLDDIDVLKSVKNPETIAANHAFIKNEVLGGLSPDAKVVFLGNVIKDDGVVPRMEQERKSDPDWVVISQAIKNADGSLAWPARYCWTDAESEATGKISLEKKRRLLGEVAYGQNFELTPYNGSDAVIRRENIRWEGLPHGTKFDRVTIGVDPAISTKAATDGFAAVAIGWIGDNRYVVEAMNLQGEDKAPDKAAERVAIMARKWEASAVGVETVSFQAMLADILRRKGLPVVEIKPHKDKLTRLLQKQAEIERNVYFVTDAPGVRALVDQLTLFPSVLHDDLVDAFVYALGTVPPIMFGL